jgi:hypothetical protein
MEIDRENLKLGEIKGLTNAFQAIKKQGEQLLKRRHDIQEQIALNESQGKSWLRSRTPANSLSENGSAIFGLVKEFNKYFTEYCILTNKKEEDFLMESLSGYHDYESSVRKLIIKCDFITGNLEQKISPITSEQRNKVLDLRNLLDKLSSEINNPVLEGNVSAAMDEYEAGHALASWLISGRVVNYLIEQIPIDDKSNQDRTTERIKYLKKVGIIDDRDRDTKELLMRAARESRQVGSHQIGISPSIVADAQSLLADSIRILERVSIKLQKHEIKQP